MLKYFYFTAILLACCFASCKDHPSNDLVGYEGPLDPSQPVQHMPTSWTVYRNSDRGGVSILLTDTTSNWLGIAHSFKSFGIPFSFTSDIKEAISNSLVFIYPSVSGKLMTALKIDSITDYAKKGGIVIASDVEGAMTEFFGLKNISHSNKRYNAYLKSDALLNEFTAKEERALFFGDKTAFDSILSIGGYTTSTATSLINLEDNSSLLTRLKQGRGTVYALGIDLGYFAQRCYTSRLYGGKANYVNGYLPTLDVLLRIVRKIYTESNISTVTIGTVPFNKELSICITHDIDFSTSMKNAVTYAENEKQQKVPATYFVQVKYIKDYNDDIFFNAEGITYLKKISADEMEIASHTVSHSRKFSRFEYGTGKEQYPGYHPYVKTADVTDNASIMGELRVSKFLLEKALGNKVKITSFRAGYLSNPESLPQALVSTGYACSSNETGNSVLTHLPYELNHNRNFDQQSGIFEYPLTLEDEENAPMIHRIDSGIEVLNKLAKYGGFASILIHPDVLGQKLAYENKIISTFKSRAWFSTLRNFDAWWNARNNVTTNITPGKASFVLTVNAPKEIKGLCLHVPGAWELSALPGIEQVKDVVIIDHLIGSIKLYFTRKS